MIISPNLSSPEMIPPLTKSHTSDLSHSLLIPSVSFSPWICSSCHLLALFLQLFSLRHLRSLQPWGKLFQSLSCQSLWFSVSLFISYVPRRLLVLQISNELPFLLPLAECYKWRLVPLQFPILEFHTVSKDVGVYIFWVNILQLPHASRPLHHCLFLLCIRSVLWPSFVHAQ